MEQSVDYASMLNEVLPFLDVLTPPSYKMMILEQVLGMTGTSSGVTLLCKNECMMDKFMDLICNDPNDKVRLECLKVLVNLTSNSVHSAIEKKIVEEDFICFLLRVLTVKDGDCCDMAAMLLSNITQTEPNCHVVFKCIREDELVEFENLINAFCIENYNSICDLHYIGSLMANLTLLKEVRALLLDKENGALPKLLPFTQYQKSVVRRLAIARMIKNCLFETDYHPWLLSEDVDIVTHLLLPLAGPEEYSTEENEELPLDLQYLPSDKQREMNREIIILLIEALFQLCATKECRLMMKKNGSYYVLRELHKSVDQDDEAILEPLENIIQVLIGDEPEQGQENLREIDIPEKIAQKFKNSADT